MLLHAHAFVRACVHTCARSCVCVCVCEIKGSDREGGGGRWVGKGEARRGVGGGVFVNE